MAEPTTIMAGAGLGTSILGSIFGASGASASGAAAGQMSQYQAGVALLNSKIAKQNADYAIMQGEQSAAKYGLGARQRKSEIIAGQSASGLDVTSGSARDVQISQDTVTKMDMDQIRQNAAKAAYDYSIEAGKYTAEAFGSILSGQQAKKAAKIQAASSIIGGASSVASKWLQGSQYGLFGSSPGVTAPY